jgi:hypothetical protein
VGREVFAAPDQAEPGFKLAHGIGD